MALIDVDSASADAFGLVLNIESMDSDVHEHRVHQLLYAVRGSMWLDTDNKKSLLPPHRAAWIPANTAHQVSSGSLALRTVYFRPSLLPAMPTTPAVFSVGSLGREMIRFAMDVAPSEPLDEDMVLFFRAFAALVRRWASQPDRYFLPTAKTAEVEAAMRYTLSRVGEKITVDDAARASGMSPRTLARRFAEQTGASWRTYLHTARILAAMRGLAEPGARVSTVAHDVGFDSLSAFSTAFRQFVGESPQAYARGQAEPDRPQEGASTLRSIRGPTAN